MNVQNQSVILLYKSNDFDMQNQSNKNITYHSDNVPSLAKYQIIRIILPNKR